MRSNRHSATRTGRAVPPTHPAEGIPFIGVAAALGMGLLSAGPLHQAAEHDTRTGDDGFAVLSPAGAGDRPSPAHPGGAHRPVEGWGGRDDR